MLGARVKELTGNCFISKGLVLFVPFSSKTAVFPEMNRKSWRNLCFRGVLEPWNQTKIFLENRDIFLFKKLGYENVHFDSTITESKDTKRSRRSEKGVDSLTVCSYFGLLK